MKDETDKYFNDDHIPLATSCNDKPCEFEDEFPWNDVRLPTFIKPIRYDIELTPNLTTLIVKGKKYEHSTSDTKIHKLIYNYH